MRLRPMTSCRHYASFTSRRRSRGPCATAVLVALAIWRIGPAPPPAIAQQVSSRGPPAADAKCELISQAQVLRLASGSNLIDVLRSRIPGLQVSTADWRSPSASSLGLRGQNSLIGPSEPLIFVDGLRLPQPGGIGQLEFINPLDVDRIEILPGPAATTYYGTGASNGVVLIYTQTGVSNASHSHDMRGGCPP